MTPATLASLHRLCFDAPRPWTEDEFSNVLLLSGVFLIEVDHGFALGRMLGPEAELLTLAIHPDHQRCGLGRKALQRFEEYARSSDAQSAVLEVATTNDAAMSLYRSAGYETVGQRPSYYREPDGRRLDAVILRKSLISDARSSA